MDPVNKLKLVLFGAGKIGRSFIGQVFSRGGYEVVFVEAYKPIVDALNKHGRYKLIHKSEKDEIIEVENVRAVHSENSPEIIKEVSSAGILAVSVGIGALPEVIQLISKGLTARLENYGNIPLDIIIAENLRDSDIYFKSALEEYLPRDYPFDQLVGLIETSIGKMVPIIPEKEKQLDILQVSAEPYNSLILAEAGFKNQIPAIEYLFPKKNIKAWVDRKLFLHNLGHASAAYLGFVHMPESNYVYEVLANIELAEKVRSTMIQSADILLKKYPDEFSRLVLIEHIDDLLLRFQNKALGDTVYRVGSDLKRKLGPRDRLIGAITTAIEYQMPFDRILYIVVCGIHFKARDENGNMHESDILVSKLAKKGIKPVLKEVCKFSEELHDQIFKQAGIMSSEIESILKN